MENLVRVLCFEISYVWTWRRLNGCVLSVKIHHEKHFPSNLYYIIRFYWNTTKVTTVPTISNVSLLSVKPSLNEELFPGLLTWRSSFKLRGNVVNRQSWTSRARLHLAAGCSVVFQCSGLLERCWLRRMKLKVMKWYLTRQEHGSTRRNQWGRKRLLLKTNEAKMDQLPAPFRILFVVVVSN